MDRFDVPSFYRFALAALCATLLNACSGGCSSCEGCGIEPIPGGFPLEDRIANSAQVRLTEGGLGFIEDNIDSIVAGVLPGGLDFPIPRTSGSQFSVDYDVCPDSDCFAHIEISDLVLSPTDPNQILAHVEVILDSRDAAGGRRPIPVEINPPIFPRATCQIDLDTRRGSREFVGLDATITLEEVIDDPPDNPRTARAGYTRIVVSDAALADGQDLQDDDIDIGGCSGYAWLLNLLKGQIIGLLQDQVSGILDSAVNDSLCTTRGETGCPDGSFSVPDEDPGSTCRYAQDENAECVSVLLGMDGQGDLGGTLIGGFSPGTHAYAQFLLAAGGHGEAVNQGMSVYMYGGMRGTDRTFEQTPAHHSCVPIHEPPPLPTIDRADAFRGNVIPGTTTETHVGIGIAESFLNYAGYGMFDSGMLCIGAGTRLSQQLSTGLVSAAIMSLPALTFPDANSPLTIAIRPQNPPIIELGANTETEPLINIQLPQTEIDFYVWSTERYIRFMTFHSTLDIGINLAVEENADGMREIVPQIAYLQANDSSVSNAELLAEQPAILAATLETLVSSLAGMLAGGLSGFALPDLMGIALDVPPGGITTVTEGSEDFLGIFANLALAGSGGGGALDRVETTLEVSDLEIDAASMNPATWAEGDGNAVWLHFGATAPAGRELEHSYRIDDGPWSAWTTASRLRVEDDILLLQARHQIEARSRVVGELSTVDHSPAQAEVVIDILAPSIEVARTVAGIEVSATDVITPAEQLDYRFFIGGEWTEWGRDNTAALATDASGVLVEVRDESGNVGRSQAALIRGLPNADGGGCGCHVEGSEIEGVPLSLLLGLLGALGFVTRKRKVTRKRRTAASGEGAGGEGRQGRRTFRPGSLARLLGGLIAVGALALLAAGCECSAPNPCMGRCIAAVPPANTSGSICCPSSDMCANYDLDALCDPGFTCSVENLELDDMCGVSCSECMAKPALDPGVLATHLDAVVDSSGSVFVSGYSSGSINQTVRYGDLVFGQWNGTAVDWEIVDGAPTTPITNDPAGWRGGVSAPGDNVGEWTSMIQQDGTFLITYYDVGNGALKLAAGGPGAWQTHTIDDVGDSGRYSSLILDSAGVPTVAYLRVVESSDTPGQVMGAVMVATANVANPGGAADWTITEVTSAPIPCRPANCGSGTTCLEAGQCVTPTTDCGDACASGSVCFNTSCQASLGNAYVEDIAPIYGLYTRIAATSGGLALVFYDRTSGNVHGVSYDGSAWGEPFLIDGYGVADPFVGDSGQGADVFVDDTDTWHVAYIDGAEETLRYAVVASDGTVSSTEVVDDGSTDGEGRHDDGRHIVGDDASIVVSGGAVRIAYQDATSQNAVIAVGAADGPWAIQHFDTQDSTGYWIEQELSGTTSYAVSWWLARQARDVSNGVRVTTLE